MQQVYKLKEGVTLDDFSRLEEHDFIVYPTSQSVAKLVTQEIDSEPVNSLLKRFYKNPEWIKKVYKKNKKILSKDLGLKYDRKGELKMTPELYSMLTSWFMTIDVDDDGWVGFTSGDSHDSIVFYSKNILDKYCSKEIFLLLGEGLIEVFDVPEE